MDWLTFAAALASLAYGLWQAWQRRRITKRSGEFYVLEQELAAAAISGDVERVNAIAAQLRALRQQARLSP